MTTDEDPLQMEHSTAGLKTSCQHWTEDISDWMDWWLTTRMATIVWVNFSLGKFRPHSIGFEFAALCLSSRKPLSTLRPPTILFPQAIIFDIILIIENMKRPK